MVIAVSYGGGTNSTALLVGLHERGLIPDFVIFADTGGELPSTYDFLRQVDQWLQRTWDMPLTVVTNGGRGQGASLEENCLRRHELPSLAYGFKGCSVKWKRQPMDRWLRDQPEVKAAWAAGELVGRMIGIDAGETRRRKLPPDDKWRYIYPLVEWGWDRDACCYAIERAGLPQPGKTSCFFCPAMKKHEVIALSKSHPDLFARAVAMEHNSKAHTIKGLGRHWTWEEVAAADRKQLCLFPESTDSPCDCMDSDDE